LELTAEATCEQIRRGMLYDIRALFDERGNFRPLHELSERDAAMIAGVDVVKRNVTSGDGQTDTVLKVRLVDRAKYVEMAAKHHGLLTEKIEHSGGLLVRWAE
jgi:phage terminase small subunit